MNNIELLKADMERNKNAVSPAEMFTGRNSLTDAERDDIVGDGNDGKTVVVETSSDGSRSTRMLDNVMDEVYEKRITGDIRAANVGDISTSLDEIRKNLADAAAVYASNANVDRDTVAAASEAAVRAMGEYMKTGVPNSDAATAVLSRMSLNKIARILPERFVSLYATNDEIASGDKEAKDRIIAALAYVIATGPELDELNSYIEREQQAMAVTQRLAQCHVDMMEMLKSRDKADELIARARSLDVHEPTVWEKYLKEPRAIHSEFARSAAIHMAFADAYTKLLEEYPDNAEARRLIDEQISESRTKASVYMSVFELTTFREVITILHSEMTSMAKSGKLTPRRVDDMAVKALDRIRRSKQNVPFPAYDPSLAKRPVELYHHYKTVFADMIANYNSTLLKARHAAFAAAGKSSDADDDDVDTPVNRDVRLIGIHGAFEKDVATAFASLLLIAFGRIMKRLDGTDKYGAIMLDCYFRLYCKLGTDIEVMADVWDACEPTVKEMINNGKIGKK